MGRRTPNTSKAAKYEVDVDIAAAFLDAKHGFDNSNPDCNLRTTFGTLVKIAIDGNLIRKDELKRQFGFDAEMFRRVKLNQSVGVDKETRASLLSRIEVRAKNTVLDCK